MMASTGEPTHWTRGDIAAACVFVTFLATMIVVPAVQLRVPFRTREIGRFGWHMYARDHRRPPLFAVYGDGAARPLVTRDAAFPIWLGDFGFREAVARHACGEAPGAQRILAIKPFLQGFREEYRCP